MPDSPPAGGSLAIGLDVGGTKVLGVLADVADPRRYRILERTEVAVSALGRGGSGDLAAQLSEVAVGLIGRREPRGIPAGVGIAGFVDLAGRVVASPNVPQAVGADLGSGLAGLTGSDPFIDNDANCVATATLALRRPPVQDLLVVTQGTGIGGAVVSGGRLVRGAHGFAGEPGHMVVVPGATPCACGQRGCWERYASGSALAEMAAGYFGDRVADRDTSDRTPPGERLVEAARTGEPRAVAVMTEFAGHVAQGLASLVNVLDPELVVLGGGLCRALDVLSEPLEAALAGNPTIGHRLPAIEPAPFAEAAGAVGASIAAASRDLQRTR